MHGVSEGVGGGIGGRGVDVQGGGVEEGKGAVRHEKECGNMTRSGHQGVQR